MPVTESPSELSSAIAAATRNESGEKPVPSPASKLWQSAAALPLKTRVAMLVGGAMIAAIYLPTLTRLVAIWNEDPDYSHGYLVLPAALAFAYVCIQRIDPAVWSSGSSASAITTGLVEIFLGLVLHALGYLFDVVMVDVLSMVCVIRGTILLVGGPKIHKAFAFPAMFLLFMAPLPPIVHQSLAIFMQQRVAAISTFVLDLFQVPIYRTGYVIYLPQNYVMTVGEACSGLRSMIAIVALAVAVGFITNGPLWYRWTLGLLALPIAGLTNCLRVILTGVILMNLGPRWADGVMHTMEGMVMVVLAAAIMLAISYGLLRMDARKPVIHAA